MVVASPNNPIPSEQILPIDLPIVDLSLERSVVRKQIVKACEEYGFFKVFNHGVPQEVIDKMEDAGFDFFGKTVAQKKEVAVIPSNNNNNPFGYGRKNIGFNGDVGEVEYLLLNGSCSNSSIPHNSKTLFSNDFRVCAYNEGVRELACKILELMAEGLAVPDTSVFSRFIADIDSDSVLRLNHYPPIPLDFNINTKVGFGEHSDPQILTLLRSNDVAGLQISLRDGLWIPVSPDPSAFSVNVGDVLEVMTNGRFKSVRHRAMTNPYKNRMSMAYFGAPPLNAWIVAAPDLVTPQRPSLYRPFTWAEYKKAAYSLRLGDSRLNLFRKCREVE